MDTFKKNLRDELNYQYISVTDLAKKTGISKRTIENYLSKRESIPPADYACKIANVLNVTVEWLINGTLPSMRTTGEDDITKNLVRDYKILPPEMQRSLSEMIHNSAEKIRKENKANDRIDYKFPTSRS